AGNVRRLTKSSAPYRNLLPARLPALPPAAPENTVTQPEEIRAGFPAQLRAWNGNAHRSVRYTGYLNRPLSVPVQESSSLFLLLVMRFLLFANPPINQPTN